MKIDREELARATEAGGWEKYKTFAKQTEGKEKEQE